MQLSQLLEICDELCILLTPWVCAPVEGVRHACKPRLVAVVEAGGAGHHILYRGRRHEALFARLQLLYSGGIRRLLLSRKGIPVRRPRKRGYGPDDIVAAHEIEKAFVKLRRVVLHKPEQAPCQPFAVDPSEEEIHKQPAEWVIHHAVQLMAVHIFTPAAHTVLIGGLLPHLA